MARLRASAVIMLAIVLLMGVMPAGALGAVTMTWERNWGSKGELLTLADGEFYYLSDVATDKWGNVYVAGGENGDHRVQMFSPDGTFLDSVGTVNVPSTLLEDPRSVTVDRWGNIYVAEKGNGGRINVFFPELYNGVSARTFDGTGDSAIGNPANISAGLDGTLYVIENANEIQRWTMTGEYISKWAPLGFGTMGIGVAQDGNVYTTTDITSGITESVIKYDAFGGYLDDWGGPGSALGFFERPYDVGTDPLENVYVIEAQGSRGQVFEPDGTFLTAFGSPGNGDGQFSGPYGIGVGLDRNVYIADTFNHRISKWNVTVSTEQVVVSGLSRYDTAVEAAKRAYPDGADTVIIATGANWPDALGGAALAGAADAPLLLTTKDALPTSVFNEIVDLNADFAYILGGTNAVSEAVVDQLETISSMTVVRLSGLSRYETANAIAAETVDLLGSSYDGTAFVATGQNFPDALAASPIAAANGWPIYLTPKLDLDPVVSAAMQSNGTTHGYLLGGTGALAPEVETALNEAPFVGFSRIDGGTRYETAANIAQAGFDGMGMLWSRPAIAVGTNFADALSGGVLQGTDYSVMLLTPPTGTDADTMAALTANRDSIYEMRFFGGDGVIPPALRTSYMALLH